ncbi:MAG TPA: hypothetical protein VJW75_01275 [Candidatus Eisenbacteria bacterium]|nr:hypothetical protein [Candidatus Eisenbacteria bacterium]
MSGSWHLSVRVRALAAAILLLAFVTGCGTAPLDPVPPVDTGVGNPAPPTGPEVLVIHPDGSVSYTRPPADPSLASTFEPQPVPAERKLVRSAVVDGAEGGTLRCGRFVLLLPAGAYDGEGTVTMSMPDSTVMIVELEIAPADLNGFQVPIDLAITTTDVAVSPDSLQLYYYNPDVKEWQALSCDNTLEDDPRLVDDAQPMGTQTKGVLTPLSHFSKYSAGKAGW